MSSLAMIKFCILILTATLALGEVSETGSQLKAIMRNAVFQTQLCNVAVQTQVVGVFNYEKKSAKSEEEISCLKKVKKAALSESSDVVSHTVGVVIFDLAQAEKDLKAGREEKVKQFLKKLDYNKYKIESKNEFKEAMKAFILTTQDKMEKCKTQ